MLMKVNVSLHACCKIRITISKANAWRILLRPRPNTEVYVKCFVQHSIGSRDGEHPICIVHLATLE